MSIDRNIFFELKNIKINCVIIEILTEIVSSYKYFKISKSPLMVQNSFHFFSMFIW